MGSDPSLDIQPETGSKARKALQLQVVLRSTGSFVLRIYPYWDGTGPGPSDSFFTPEVRPVTVELADCAVSAVTDLVADTYAPGPRTEYHPPTQIRVFTKYPSPADTGGSAGPGADLSGPQSADWQAEHPRDPGPMNSEWQATHRVASDVIFADIDDRTLEVFLIEAWDEEPFGLGLYRART